MGFTSLLKESLHNSGVLTTLLKTDTHFGVSKSLVLLLVCASLKEGKLEVLMVILGTVIQVFCYQQIKLCKE